MSVSQDPPKMMPGASADAWRALAWVLLRLAVPAMVITVALSVLNLIHGAGYLWFIPVIALFGSLFIVFFLATARAKKEVSAGYTTVWGENPEVPQLDPATGLMVRRAGEVYVKKADWKRGTGGTVALPVPVVPRPSVWQRLLPSLPSGLTVGVVIVLPAIYGRFTTGWWAGNGTTVSVGFLALVVVGNGVAILLARARLARLRAVVPHDFLFLFTSTRDFRERANTMNWQGGVEGPSRSKSVSANSAGMAIWQGNPPVRGVTVPWSSVVSVQADLVSQGRTTLPSVLVSIRDEANGVHGLQLVNANADWLPLGSMPEVRWIASELNALRTATTTARIL